MVEVLKNPHGLDEYTVVEKGNPYHETTLEDLAPYYNGDEIGLVNLCEQIGAKVEYYSHRQDKYVTKEDYMNHFKDYNSDIELILPTAICNKEQADCIAHVLNKIA